MIDRTFPDLTIVRMYERPHISGGSALQVEVTDPEGHVFSRSVRMNSIQSFLRSWIPCPPRADVIAHPAAEAMILDYLWYRCDRVRDAVSV